MAQEIRKSEAGVTPVQRYVSPFSTLRAELDRVFDAVVGSGFGRFPKLAEFDDDVLVPSIDVRETDSEFAVEAELPGLDEKDVSVTLNNGVLTLKGEKKSERDEKKDNYHLTERSYGSFERSFQLDDSADPDAVKATFDKGVLKITIAKRPETKTAEKRIPIGKA